MVSLDIVEGSSKIHSRPSRRSRRRPVSDQRFSAYLSFSFPTTVCLGIFLAIYALLFLGLFPLLHQEAPSVVPVHRGEVLRPVVSSAVERFKQMPHVPGQRIAEGIAENVAGAIKKKIYNFRQTQGVTDASLMKKAEQEMATLRKRREDNEKESAKNTVVVTGKLAPGKRAGVMVLGMHRSGTSMLADLIMTGMGYKTGGPLIGGAFDNEKGFFELIDAVLENDELMGLQRIWWSANVINYDHEKALEDKKNGKASFEHGRKALKVLNNPANVPYLQKDPRMCITLRTWLPLLNAEPAILFTYRHPLEVALSLKKRERNFPLEHGLRLWIVYNMRAIQNSAGLCRVLSSNEAILSDPLHEIQRISEDLTNKCGVPPPPRSLTQDDVDKFIDPGLQHNKKQREAEDASKEVIAEYGDCKVHDYATETAVGTPEYERERSLYLMAMKIFCDLKSDEAYKTSYEWPELN